MAVWLSSSVLLVLLISALGWLPTPGSAFHMYRDHSTSSGLSLIFHHKYSEEMRRYRNESFFRQVIRLSMCVSSNINKRDSDFVFNLMLTFVIASYVRHQLLNAVFAWMHAQKFTVEQTLHFPDLLVINNARVNIWLEL